MDKSLKSTIDNQKNYFKSKKTFNVEFRIQKLKDLLEEIKSSENSNILGRGLEKLFISFWS